MGYLQRDPANATRVILVGEDGSILGSGSAFLVDEDPWTALEAQHVTLTPATDTTITFASNVVAFRVVNWSTTDRVLVKTSTISGTSDAAAARVGIAPAADVPNVRSFPIDVASIHLYSAGAAEVTVEGFVP